MKDCIIKKLKEKYPRTEFIFKQESYLLVLLYDNEKLEEDEKFFDYVIDLAYEYLDEEMQEILSIEYDDFGEIEEYSKRETQECSKRGSQLIFEQLSAFDKRFTTNKKESNKFKGSFDGINIVNLEREHTLKTTVKSTGIGKIFNFIDETLRTLSMTDVPDKLSVCRSDIKYSDDIGNYNVSW